MGRLVHINGPAGVGKLTIARIMAPRLGARLLDNHAIYNVAFALTEFRSPAFYEAARALRTTAYDQILRMPDDEMVILTDALFDDSDWARETWQALDRLTKERRWPFLSITLACDPAEHRRRIVSEERALRGKVRDVAYVDQALTRPLFERTGRLSTQLDITDRSTEDSATTLIDWVNAIMSPTSMRPSGT
jgi:MoxR-like ATPase